MRAERARQRPDILLELIVDVVGGQEIAISTIAYTELVHGTYRARTNAERTFKRSYLDEIMSALPVYDYTMEAAELAGKIDAEARIAGLIIPFADLLIGATALSIDFSILTSNERHFRMIPGLRVVSF